MTLKVGDTLHYFDINRRAYTKPAPGRMYGDSIYAAHFVPHKIIGNPGRYWIVENGYGGTLSVAKKKVDAVPATLWFSDAGKADNIWVHDHRHKLRELLNQADPERLRAIAAILGYTP